MGYMSKSKLIRSFEFLENLEYMYGKKVAGEQGLSLKQLFPYKYVLVLVIM